jgi:hypothetical protein
MNEVGNASSSVTAVAAAVSSKAVEPAQTSRIFPPVFLTIAFQGLKMLRIRRICTRRFHRVTCRSLMPFVAAVTIFLPSFWLISINLSFSCLFLFSFPQLKLLSLPCPRPVGRPMQQPIEPAAAESAYVASIIELLLPAAAVAAAASDQQLRQKLLLMNPSASNCL